MIAKSKRVLLPGYAERRAWLAARAAARAAREAGEGGEGPQPEAGEVGDAPPQ